MSSTYAFLPTQAYCRLCERLFCYFRTSKPRIYCSPCVEIERRAALVFNYDKQRRERHEARETARLIHAEAAA